MILRAALTATLPRCGVCEQSAEIEMRGYAEDGRDIFLCGYHALQLARKLTEDLCDLAGDRHV